MGVRELATGMRGVINTAALAQKDKGVRFEPRADYNSRANCPETAEVTQNEASFSTRAAFAFAATRGGHGYGAPLIQEAFALTWEASIDEPSSGSALHQLNNDIRRNLTI